MTNGRAEGPERPTPAAPPSYVRPNLISRKYGLGFRAGFGRGISFLNWIRERERERSPGAGFAVIAGYARGRLFCSLHRASFSLAATRPLRR